MVGGSTTRGGGQGKSDLLSCFLCVCAVTTITEKDTGMTKHKPVHCQFLFLGGAVDGARCFLVSLLQDL